MGAAQTFDRTVLQDAKQLHLHAQRHVVDVVEKDRPPLSQFEPSRPILDGPGERAPFMAEELRLDQRLREQCTADRDERTMFAPARLVNQPGNDFLPRAALSGDEHGAVAPGDDADELEHGAHFRTATDDECLVCVLRSGEHGRSFTRLGGCQSPAWPPARPSRRRDAGSCGRLDIRHTAPKA